MKERKNGDIKFVENDTVFCFDLFFFFEDYLNMKNLYDTHMEI